MALAIAMNVAAAALFVGAWALVVRMVYLFAGGTEVRVGTVLPMPSVVRALTRAGAGMAVGRRAGGEDPGEGARVFVVERHLPGVTADQLLAAARRVKRAAAQVTAEGTQVRYVRSTFLPSDGTCSCVFQGASEQAVRRANDVARVPYVRVVRAMTLQAAQLD